MGGLIEARRRLLLQSGLTDAGYVADGLIFWLDGLRKGDTPNVWRDRIQGISFDFVSSVFAANGVTLGESGYGQYAGQIGSDWQQETIEVACSGGTTSSAYLYQCKIGDAVPIGYIHGSGTNTAIVMDGSNHPRVVVSSGWHVVSANCVTAMRDLQQVAFGANDSWGKITSGFTTIGCRKWTSSSNPDYKYKGTIHSIRIYNRHLSLNEMAHNQEVDRRRFGLTF